METTATDRPRLTATISAADYDKYGQLCLYRLIFFPKSSGPGRVLYFDKSMMTCINPKAEWYPAQPLLHKFQRFTWANDQRVDLIWER